MSNEARQLQEYIESKMDDLKTGEAFDRLIRNPDFQLIIDTKYFDEYAKGLVYNLASVKEDKERHQDYIEELEAIGRVRAFLSSIKQLSGVAKEEIAHAEAELEELRLEGND